MALLPGSGGCTSREGPVMAQCKCYSKCTPPLRLVNLFHVFLQHRNLSVCLAVHHCIRKRPEISLKLSQSTDLRALKVSFYDGVRCAVMPLTHPGFMETSQILEKHLNKDVATHCCTVFYLELLLLIHAFFFAVKWQKYF